MSIAIVRPAELAYIDHVTPMYGWLLSPPGSRPAHWDPHLAATAVSRAVSCEAAVVLLAVLESEFVGLCTAYDDIESVRFGCRVWVEDLAVDAKRSLGVGKQLLDEAKRWARARDATRLRKPAWTRIGSTRANNRDGGPPASAGSYSG